MPTEESPPPPPPSGRFAAASELGWILERGGSRWACIVLRVINGSESASDGQASCSSTDPFELDIA